MSFLVKLYLVYFFLTDVFGFDKVGSLLFLTLLIMSYGTVFQKSKKRVL